MSYILEIETEKATNDDLVYCGVVSNTPSLCKCPNCKENMFPIFSVNKKASCAPKFDYFYVKDFFILDVCPSCSHGLKNYYVRYEQDVRIAGGGFIDGKGPSNYIDQPFESRTVKINPIDVDLWSDASFINNILDRKFFDGVCHQLGGLKLKQERNPLTACLCCKSEQISYIGTIDYDDLNIPLYEKGKPCALIIGDMQSINVYACNECRSLNYGITD